MPAPSQVGARDTFAPVQVSLLHASRGQPDRAESTIAEWTTRESGAHAIEWLLGVDADDPCLGGYRRVARARGVQLLVGEARSRVAAVNAAARKSSGDLLVVVSDDVGCPRGWERSRA